MDLWIQDQSLKPSLTWCTPRETSDTAVVIKNEFAPAGNHDQRECRTVRAYGTVVRWSTRNRITYRTVRAYGTQMHRMEKTI